MTQSGPTTPSQSGPGSNGIERVGHIPEIYKAGASPSDGLMSYSGHSFGWGLTAQSVYSTATVEYLKKSSIHNKSD